MLRRDCTISVISAVESTVAALAGTAVGFALFFGSPGMSVGGLRR